MNGAFTLNPPIEMIVFISIVATEVSRPLVYCGKSGGSPDEAIVSIVSPPVGSTARKAEASFTVNRSTSAPPRLWPETTTCVISGCAFR